MLSALFEESIEKMAGESTSVRSINPHPRIDVVKFNGTNSFGMWRCEIMDALTTSNLEDTLRLEKKRASITEEDWDKMKRSACGLLRSCLTQDIKYQVLHETSASSCERSWRRSI